MQHSIRSRRLALGILSSAALCCTADAQADDFVVYSPYVTNGQSEVEFRSAYQQDNDPTLSGTFDYELSISHAFTDWWQPEIYLGKFERTPDAGNHLIGYELENFFQFTPQGEYWADAGMVFSYEHADQPGDVSSLEFGPLLEKRSGHFNQRLNLIWEKEFGAGAGGKYEFRAAYSLSYRINSAFAPGLEAYIRPSDKSYSIGPVLNGELASASGNELEYRFGVVFGLNPDAPNAVWLAQLEYEFN